MEAHFTGQAFAPHRHDTYAIGITLAGVQTFAYRGERRRCLAGEGHVLHPDERHDGGAGTEDGFGYRIAYVDPALVQAALGGRPLPFLADPVLRRHDLDPALVDILGDIDTPIGPLEHVEIVAAVAAMLEHLAPAAPKRRAPLRLAALARVRELIADDPARPLGAGRLERIAGLDRWTIARQFRAAFGTSPSRFRTMRQLDRARRLMTTGVPLCEAALAAGFADQSHMARQFKQAYGLTPAVWTTAAGPQRITKAVP